MSFNYDITLSGLFTSQQALKVTQNNISNAGTDGYARQQIDIEETGSLSKDGISGQMGNGSMVKSVKRIVDEYLIQQTRDSSAKVGYFKQLSSSLGEIENMFNENTDQSITNMMSNMFSAFEEANKYPEDMAYRQSLLGQAQTFTSTVNTISNNLNALKGEVDSQVTEKVTKINELITNIAEVNEKMAKMSTENPNSLLDERDKDLDELSNYLNISIKKDDKNVVSITSNGIDLVSGGTPHLLKANYLQSDNEWALSVGTVNYKPVNGELASAIEMRNTIIPDYETKLNDLISNVVTEVNNLHSTGYGLDDSTGNLFFTGTNASSIAVNSTLLDDPKKIALSSLVSTPGNSDIGKAIANLPTQNIASLGNITINDYYSNFVFKMANDVNVAKTNETVHEGILSGIHEQKESVQGVNIDEEMTNLLKYQKFFTANSKMLATLDKTYDSLLQIIN
jgi:flagellar hook-associated protein 1 FlgK